MNLIAAFRSIYERDPTAEEVNQFNRIARELDIRDNDALWAVTFLMGHHLDLAKNMPEQIEKQVTESLQKYRTELDRARAAAESEMKATKQRIEENVSKAVVVSAQTEIANAAQVVARDTARRSWLQWLGAAAIVGMLLAGGIFYWGYHTGSSAGYTHALTAKAAANWAASPIGLEAYRLYRDGDLTAIVRCSRSGWRIKTSRDGRHKVCIVGPDADGTTFGWYLPRSQ